MGHSPPVFGAPVRVSVWEFNLLSSNNRVSFTVLIERQLVTDRKTSGHSIHRASIASRGKSLTTVTKFASEYVVLYGTFLVKIN